MSNEPDTYPIVCAMEITQAASVLKMLKSHSEFSGIEMKINPNEEKNCFQSGETLQSEVRVTFCIPKKGIDMVDFFGEMNKTLNHELTTTQKERV